MAIDICAVLASSWWANPARHCPTLSVSLSSFATETNWNDFLNRFTFANRYDKGLLVGASPIKGEFGQVGGRRLPSHHMIVIWLVAASFPNAVVHSLLQHPSCSSFFLPMSFSSLHERVSGARRLCKGISSTDQCMQEHLQEAGAGHVKLNLRFG